ncbi:MAG: 16S rRNA (cytidine(1402)-2'-O)-methyltransferase [Deltaproteobacteria bacterium]|nr:16S rRNA (cytidine(1402)-2'-O)-methyltransferase [Deltaproteobacteria bacterium]
MAAPLTSRRGPAGVLHVVATPIGNLGDLTLRATEILRTAQLIACEDTRRTRALLAHLGISGVRLVSLFEHNEERRIASLLETLLGGSGVCLVSDAGTPTISDPGYRLVSACAAQGIPVVPIPGPCAAVAALSASGLPTDRFLFLGFPPHRKGRLDAFLAEALEPGRTAILYAPLRRVPALLERLATLAPDARVVIARELTKVHEELLRGTVRELLDGVEHMTLKGECTLLVHRGKEESPP